MLRISPVAPAQPVNSRVADDNWLTKQFVRIMGWEMGIEPTQKMKTKRSPEAGGID
jgi:hypothetical protein